MARAPRLKLTRAEQRTLSRQLSPFELKDKLIQLAGEASRQGAATMLNAGRAVPRTIPIAGMIIAAIALAAIVSGPVAAKGKHRAKVGIKVETKTQKQLLRGGELSVRLKARRAGKVKLTAAFRKRRRMFEREVVHTHRKRVRRSVELELTDAGEKRLGRCGAKEIKVRALYRVAGL